VFTEQINDDDDDDDDVYKNTYDERVVKLPTWNSNINYILYRFESLLQKRLFSYNNNNRLEWKLENILRA